MNQTTRVIRFHKTGGPEVLRIEEVRRPKPTGSEVLVRVEALGLSRSDFVWREGSSFEEPVFPAQIGYDAAGVVESILNSGCRQEPQQLSVQRNSFLTAWFQDIFRQWSIESFSDWTNMLLRIVTWRLNAQIGKIIISLSD